VGRHHAHPPVAERHQVHFAQPGQVGVDDRQNHVRVGVGVAVAGKALAAITRRVSSCKPLMRSSPPLLVFAKRAVANDRLPGFFTSIRGAKLMRQNPHFAELS
jgi:hypothetical protein